MFLSSVCQLFATMQCKGSKESSREFMTEAVVGAMDTLSWEPARSKFTCRFLKWARKLAERDP